MATVTKPIALDESLNTTELSSRNVADVLAQELSAVATAIGGIAVPSADHVSYDNSVSGLSATDVQDAIDELASEKVDKEAGKGLSTNDYTDAEKTKLAGIEAGAEVNPTSSTKTATESFETANGGLLSKCMIDLVPVQSGSGDPSPDNVRPISGHTEVDLDVKDEDNVTQHTYQVQIGSTVYGGTVDLVSGVMIATHALVTYVGTENWGVDSGTRIYYLLLPSNYRVNNTILANKYKGVSPRNNADISDNECALSTSYAYLNVRDETATSTSDFTTKLSQTNLEVLYKLATPQTIQLTPQQIEALPNQNNLSTPLSGQSIETNGVEYKELFTFADMEKVVSLRVPISMLGTDESGRTTASQSYASGDYFYKDGYMCKALTSISAGATLTLNTNYEYSTLDEILESKVDKSDIYANAGSHNSIYRGKYLGSSVTAEQWSAIQNGTFDDLFIGDYWTINSVNWRIAHFDYWLGTGDTKCTNHHVVIVPDTVLYNAKMNSSNVTTGGYYNSEMRGGANYLVQGSSGLYDTKVAIDNAFGSSHILSHRVMLTNATSNGNASGWAWYDSTVDLMSEVMVYGHLAWSVGGKGYETGIDKEQLALFRLDHSRICNRASWWLRGVGSAANFACVYRYGFAHSADASYSFGVRPAFAIK